MVWRTLFYASYLGLGFVQLFAIMAGAQLWWGVGGFASFLIAGFTTYIPFAGQALGIYGAVSGWGWGWIQAVLLFGFPLLLFLLAALFSRDS